MQHSRWTVYGLTAMAGVLLAEPCAHAAPVNIAQGATVSVIATDPDPNAGFNNGTLANLQNITNGTLLPESTAYGSTAAVNQAVEWNGAGYVFQISLSGQYTINSLLVDADDNDVYQLNYLNAQGQWVPLYTAPIVSQGFGFRTRPNDSDPTQIYTLPSPVVTDAVEIFGGQSNDNLCYDGACGQGGYGIAQVELFGSPFVAGVPEASTWVMMIFGFCSVGLFSYRRKRPTMRLA